MKEIHYICVSPQGSRRSGFWREVVTKQGHSYHEFTYQTAIQQIATLSQHKRYVVRLESPGEDFATYRFCLSLGCQTPEETAWVNQLQEQFGLVAAFGLWYRGWQKLLKQIEETFTSFDVIYLNHPQAIQYVFDKYQTQLLLQQNGVQVPLQLGKAIQVEQILYQMKQHKITQVFLKPCSGSSASGVMAFRYGGPQRQVLYTTIKKQKGEFFNSLVVQQYTKPQEIEEFINKMATQDLMIEQWVPKWQHQGLSIDFRVVVMNEEVVFILPRGSKSMMTNLHLGNQKMILSELGLPETVIDKIKDTAIKAMACFPTLGYAGVDILLDRQLQPYVLEINAFGDMLLHTTSSSGLTMYEEAYTRFSFDNEPKPFLKNKI